MKKMLSVMVALMMVASLSTALALERDEVIALAQSLVGDAKLIEAELEDGVFELEFRDASAEYDVKISRNGETLEIKTEFYGIRRAAAPTYSLEEARNTALSLYPNTDVLLTLLEQNKGFYSIKVFLRSADALIEVELSADTGTLMEKTVFPMAPSQGIGAHEIAGIIAKWAPGAEITELEMTLDDGRRIYEGEATANGKRYEFEVALDTGDVVQWEQDWD